VRRGVVLPYALNKALNEQYCGIVTPSLNIIEFVSFVKVVFYLLLV
jgi:hypothetical protein